MYTIVGADGKEYGPVPADKVREWIAGGRVNAATKIRRDGDSAWTTVGALPEFAAAPVAPPPPSSSGTPAATAPSSVDASTLIARAAPLDISDCLKRGWASGRAHFWSLLGVSLLIGLCAGVLGAIPLVGPLCSLLLTGVFYGGLYYYCLQKVRGEPVELGDAFSGFTVGFVQLMLASVVCILLTLIGFVCLILPGIYLGVAWIFAYLVIREKGLPFWDGMELCRRVVTAQWWRVFGLLLMLGVLSLVCVAIPGALLIGGALAMPHGSGPAGVAMMALGGLGILVVTALWIPVFTASLMHVYDDLFNPASA